MIIRNHKDHLKLTENPHCVLLGNSSTTRQAEYTLKEGCIILTLYLWKISCVLDGDPDKRTGCHFNSKSPVVSALLEMKSI